MMVDTELDNDISDVVIKNRRIHNISLDAVTNLPDELNSPTPMMVMIVVVRVGM